MCHILLVCGVRENEGPGFGLACHTVGARGRSTGAPKVYLWPDGSSYSGRKQAVDYMVKSKYSQQDIKIMESGFKIKWIDDDPSLPDGESFVIKSIALILTVKLQVGR